ncbi:hypothetical protein D7V94_04760 [Parablautia intestinalis]|uniref:DUF5716 domain-containing protein n=1 Tax=Parablautia intestinalis TaxID=2320100 RepID=A0A3A9APF1_9FIRM|nr:DUF5716 family protein [Parablautia intestinalis]RKI93277.1 hypothetical protein D7V94_04760 [Parablautia intestinalis]
MLQDRKDMPGKKNNKKVAVGYELGKSYAQISFCYLEETEPETVSAVTGTEQYNIPTVLCKRKGVGQWYYGKEAIKFAREEEGILVEDLSALAERGEDVLVEGEAFDPAALLTLFVKRSLSLLNMRVSLNQIEAFMFTMEELTPRMVDVLGKVAAGLNLKAKHICFQNHMESFYAYTLHQNKELWKNDVVIFEYDTVLKSLWFKCNARTTPQVVMIEQQEYPQMQRRVWKEEEEKKTRQMEELDQLFLSIAERALQGEIVSTVFLLGDGFKEEWAKESLKFLCRNRRAFKGNNLYSKGACYSMMERLNAGRLWKEYVYLGEDKLKSNIGMRALRRGEDSYYAILDAGTNWYEISSDFDIILESGNTVEFVITPMTGGKVENRTITLEGLPQRPRATTRLNVHIEMTAVSQATVTIEDMGFGELFSSSGKAWTQTIMV